MECNKIDVQSKNSEGKTALQIIEESPPNATSLEIKKILKRGTNFSKRLVLEILKSMSDITMVVVVLIATMAFQAAVSPPGGVWQDDSSLYRAGKAVMASTHPKMYKHFVRDNTTAFVSSLVTIFLLTTRLPSINLFHTKAVTYTMWVSLASIAVSYGASIMAITPNMETQSFGHVIKIVIMVSTSLFGLFYVGIYLLVLQSWWKSRKRRHQDPTPGSLLREMYHLLFEVFH